MSYDDDDDDDDGGYGDAADDSTQFQSVLFQISYMITLFYHFVQLVFYVSYPRRQMKYVHVHHNVTNDKGWSVG